MELVLRTDRVDAPLVELLATGYLVIVEGEAGEILIKLYDK